MGTYILRKMLNHLAVLIFVNTVYVSLRHIGKSSYVEYDMNLVKQQMQDVLITAAAIGVSFAAISFFVVLIIQWDQNIMVVIAAFFISVGMGRQITATALDAVTTSMNSFLSSWASTLHLLAKNRLMTPEWRSIENHVEAIFLGKKLEYDLPAKLAGVKPDSPQLYKFLNESKRELEYQDAITSEDPSCIVFAQHATEQMRDKLRVYDQLLEVQERSGGVNTVVLIAIGTLIWLLS